LQLSIHRLGDELEAATKRQNPWNIDDVKVLLLTYILYTICKRSVKLDRFHSLSDTTIQSLYTYRFGEELFLRIIFTSL